MTEITWKHDVDNFYEACGKSEAQMEELKARYDALIDQQNTEHTWADSHSGWFQMVYDNFDKLEAMIIVDGVAGGRSSGGIQELLAALRGESDD